jgi:hypothetical protein
MALLKQTSVRRMAQLCTHTQKKIKTKNRRKKRILGLSAILDLCNI